MKFSIFFESAEQEAAFWEAIIEDDEPTSRLVYADWLEENNFPNFQYAGLLRGTDKFHTNVTNYDMILNDETGDLVNMDEVGDGAKNVTWEQLIQTIRYPKNDDDYVYLNTPRNNFEYPQARLGPTTGAPMWIHLETGDHMPPDGNTEGWEEGTHRMVRRRLNVYSHEVERLPMWLWHIILRQAGWYTT